MKKFVLLGAFSLLFAACGSSNSSSPPPPPPPPPSPDGSTMGGPDAGPMGGPDGGNQMGGDGGGPSSGAFPEGMCAMAAPVGTGMPCPSGQKCLAGNEDMQACADDGMGGVVDPPNCKIVDWACVTAGTNKAGQNCTQMEDAMMNYQGDDCEPGAFCINYATMTGGMGPYMCQQMCDPTAGGDPNPACSTTTGWGSKCMPQSTYYYSYTNFSLCTAACKLGSPADCPTGFSCKLGFTAQKFMCWKDGTVPVGSTCMGTASCVAGSTCNTSGGQMTCRKNCDVNNPCPTGTTCMMLATDASKGGICL